MNKHSAMNKKNVKNNKTVRTKHWMKENCLQRLQQKKQKQRLKVERRWTENEKEVQNGASSYGG